MDQDVVVDKDKDMIDKDKDVRDIEESVGQNDEVNDLIGNLEAVKKIKKKSWQRFLQAMLRGGRGGTGDTHSGSADTEGTEGTETEGTESPEMAYERGVRTRLLGLGSEKLVEVWSAKLLGTERGSDGKKKNIIVDMEVPELELIAAQLSVENKNTVKGMNGGRELVEEEEGGPEGESDSVFWAGLAIDITDAADQE